MRRHRWFRRFDWGTIGLMASAAAILAAIILVPPLLGWDDAKIELQILIGGIIFLVLVVISYRRR